MRVQGNILLDALLKAEVVRCSAEAQAETLARVAADERARGNTPYVIPVGGSTAVGAMGYAAMMGELAGQAARLALSPAAIFFHRARLARMRGCSPAHACTASILP
ncbi:MAG: hypothetical protein IPO29_19835 [Anaerolineae bacterium]|nr:hypothetical protein [Anaerolineae bacterium]